MNTQKRVRLCICNSIGLTNSKLKAFNFIYAKENSLSSVWANFIVYIFNTYIHTYYKIRKTTQV